VRASPAENEFPEAALFPPPEVSEDWLPVSVGGSYDTPAAARSRAQRSKTGGDLEWPGSRDKQTLNSARLGYVKALKQPRWDASPLSKEEIEALEALRGRGGRERDLEEEYSPGTPHPRGELTKRRYPTPQHQLRADASTAAVEALIEDRLDAWGHRSKTPQKRRERPKESRRRSMDDMDLAEIDGGGGRSSYLFEFGARDQGGNTLPTERYIRKHNYDDSLLEMGEALSDVRSRKPFYPPGILRGFREVYGPITGVELQDAQDRLLRSSHEIENSIKRHSRSGSPYLRGGSLSWSRSPSRTPSPSRRHLSPYKSREISDTSLFDAMDTNGDGLISRQEWDKAQATKRIAAARNVANGSTMALRASRSPPRQDDFADEVTSLLQDMAHLMNSKH